MFDTSNYSESILLSFNIPVSITNSPGKLNGHPLMFHLRYYTKRADWVTGIIFTIPNKRV